VIGEFYQRVYDRLCGLHPNLYPWHFQWMAGKNVRAGLPEVLASLKGMVLDVGCGDQPYRGWLGGVRGYVGIDVAGKPGADIIVSPEGPWPFRGNSFDVVLCTQVIEHVPNLVEALLNIQNALKPGGTLIVTAPFIYNEHTGPADYRRFTIHGLRKVISERFDIIGIVPQGGVGSTLATLFLNWMELMSSRFKVLRFVKGLVLPLWMMHCLAVNGLGWLLDKIDNTEAFYSNVLIIGRKRST
jgi:SAM-dependent methyltransferase